ncbi:MAG: cytochrome C biogenesis protein, partial [Nanoarchaeota archaeon]
MPEINLFIAFFAGILAFLSPCVLPLIPAFLAYLAGTTVSEAQQANEAKLKIIINVIFFCLGFAIVFAIIGAVLNSILLGVSFGIRTW